jgi:HAD superfamily hydrolase (TIGR01484 family)
MSLLTEAHAVSDFTKADGGAVTTIMFDIDDTITTRGKLTKEAYTALWDLHEAGFAVIPVTGRSAGWCEMIAREWPCDAVIGENGAFAFWEERTHGGKTVLNTLPHPNAVEVFGNDKLEYVKKRALKEVPGLRIAKGQFAHIYDIALDFAEEEPDLGVEAAKKVVGIANSEGVNAKYSSCHVHIHLGEYTKADMAVLLLTKHFGVSEDKFDNTVLFAGDSVNDCPMWERFKLGFAVANIYKAEKDLTAAPAFIASKSYGEGFCEIAEKILSFR